MSNVSNEEIPDFGLVMIRHVNSEATNLYWRESYHCMRRFYSEPILIIDDNSNPIFLNSEGINLINCTIVKGEFTGAGEILGYYYFHKLHPFKKAVVVHDSTFFNQRIDFSKVEDVQFMWGFRHFWDEDYPTISLISHFDDCPELIRMYVNKPGWDGCFGVMSVIEWDFLDKMEHRHKFLDIIVNKINSRPQRMLIERIYATVCQVNAKSRIIPLLGDIHAYCRHTMSFQDHISGNAAHLPLTKIWTGR
ncbi:Hypothetical protein HVR_LOCUS513 [uncultured virus]|nr:Hypothetical protein HVR_LOCUS513 [uncultured virus]